MKRTHILAILVLVIALGIWIYTMLFPRVDADFATRASLRFHYADKRIDVRAIRDTDFRELKQILRGRACRASIGDEPSCGFSTDVSITFTDGRRSITFCPACDKCDGVRIGRTDRYFDIGKPGRARMESILARYGMTFPCI